MIAGIPGSWALYGRELQPSPNGAAANASGVARNGLGVEDPYQQFLKLLGDLPSKPKGQALLWPDRRGQEASMLSVKKGNRTAFKVLDHLCAVERRIKPAGAHRISCAGVVLWV